MKRYLLAILLCVTFAQSAVAEPPTRASLEKLFLITNTEKLIDSQYSMMSPNMTEIFKNLNLPGTDSPEAKREANRVSNIVLPKIVKLFREEMGWKAFKEDYIKLYSSMFSQLEINSFISFYESSAGRSYLDKIPSLTQKSSEIRQEKMKVLYPKLNQIIIGL